MTGIHHALARVARDDALDSNQPGRESINQRARPQYDPIGRLERRFPQASAGAQMMLDAAWYFDQSRKGVLDWFEGVTDGYRRDFTYDSLLRPTKVTTKVPKLDAAASPDPSYRTFSSRRTCDCLPRETVRNNNGNHNSLGDRERFAVGFS